MTRIISVYVLSDQGRQYTVTIGPAAAPGRAPQAAAIHRVNGNVLHQ